MRVIIPGGGGGGGGGGRREEGGGGGRGFSICQGICIGSAGKTPRLQPPWSYV